MIFDPVAISIAVASGIAGSLAPRVWAVITNKARTDAEVAQYLRDDLMKRIADLKTDVDAIRLELHACETRSAKLEARLAKQDEVIRHLTDKDT